MMQVNNAAEFDVIDVRVTKPLVFSTSARLFRAGVQLSRPVSEGKIPAHIGHLN